MCVILWIDDQCKDKEMLPFIMDAESEGLNLEGFEYPEDAFEVLENNLGRYDAILLDGIFYRKTSQVAGTNESIPLGMAIAKINELKSKKVFPWFVLSGQSKFTKGENSLLEANKVRCYDKTNRSDVADLFIDLKKAAADQPDYDLKRKYSDVLESCSDQYFGLKQFNRVFKLCKQLEQKEVIQGTEDMLLPLRKLLEATFVKLSDLGVLPALVVSSSGWINKSRLFISNGHSDFTHNTEIFPSLVVENLNRLLSVLQDSSHGDGTLKLKVDGYIQTCSNDFLFRSNVFLLFDLFAWLKIFIDEHQDVEHNKSLWKSKFVHGEWIKGKVISISEDGWGVFVPDASRTQLGVPPSMVKSNELAASDSIKVITSPSPDGKKTFVTDITKDV